MFPGRGTRTHSPKPLTWHDLLTVGLGELGLNPWELYEYSLQEFVFKLEGTRYVHNIDYRNGWEQTRELAWVLSQVSGNLKKSTTKFHIMQFSWDERKAKKGLAQMSGVEQKEAVAAMIANAQNVWKTYLNKN